MQKGHFYSCYVQLIIRTCDILYVCYCSVKLTIIIFCFDCRSLLADYIEKFCAMLPESVPGEEQIKDYMMALTLSHFLRELCKPRSAHTIDMSLELKVNKAGLQDMKKFISDNIT